MYGYRWPELADTNPVGPDKHILISRYNHMSTIRKPTRLGGVPIDQSCHVCGFFRTNEEAYEVLMPFIKEGIEEGERALHIIDPSRLAGHRSRLEAAGIGLKTAEKNGQHEIESW